MARPRPRGMESMTARLGLLPIALSVLSTLSLVLTPLTVSAQEQLTTGDTAVVFGTEGSGLRVRSGPGSTSTVLVTLRDAERVEITGEPVESNGTIWYPVKTARARGWSNAQYLKAAGPSDAPTTASMRFAAPADPDGGPEVRMFQMLNEARVARGLNPLAWNAELARASKAHGEDMARRGYMEHTNPEGQDPRARALNHGYVVPPRTAWLVIETISARPTVEAAMEWLLSHHPHSGVLLRPVWREVGAAYVQGGPYGQFWVMNFGCRPNVLPVFASVGPASLSADFTLTNELCTPNGQGDYMGKATEMQISSNPEFAGTEWEPYRASKTVSNPGPRMYVRLRDAQGRMTRNELSLPGIVQAAGQSAPLASSSTQP